MTLTLAGTIVLCSFFIIISIGIVGIFLKKKLVKILKAIKASDKKYK